MTKHFKCQQVKQLIYQGQKHFTCKQVREVCFSRTYLIFHDERVLLIKGSPKNVIKLLDTVSSEIEKKWTDMN